MTKKEKIKESYAQLGLDISLSENNPLEENGLVSLTDIMKMAHKKIRLKDVYEFIQEHFIITDLGYYPKSLQRHNNMKISLENYLRNKIDEVESMHSYELATDTIRCWIDEYNEKLQQPLVSGSVCKCEKLNYSYTVPVCNKCNKVVDISAK